MNAGRLRVGFGVVFFKNFQHDRALFIFLVTLNGHLNSELPQYVPEAT